MTYTTKMDQIEELLTRGVANIIPAKSELEQVLKSGRKLNIYCGFDVTAPQLHVGNGVPLRKLQQFVELGHNVTFLIGDFTTLVGDTSDKETERPIISDNDIDSNWKNYSAQAGKILDLNRVTIRRNSEWLSPLTFKQVVRLMQKFSLNDFISRELIKKRLSSGGSINLSEVVYPVMQGYDSYFMDTDIQVGATDQTFNMQAGRTLQKQLRGKESFVMTFDFLMGTDGRKMSKSWGNAIWLNDSPEEMYGKVMSLQDELIIPYFTLSTNTPLKDIAAIHESLSSGENPMLFKKQLAHRLVSELHSVIAANAAQENFEKTVQKSELPEDVDVVLLRSLNLVDALVESGLVESKSSAKRLIDQGGVEVNGEKVTDPNFILSPDSTLKAGKRKFVKIGRS